MLANEPRIKIQELCRRICPISHSTHDDRKANGIAQFYVTLTLTDELFYNVGMSTVTVEDQQLHNKCVLLKIHMPFYNNILAVRQTLLFCIATT